MYLIFIFFSVFYIDFCLKSFFYSSIVLVYLKQFFFFLLSTIKNFFFLLFFWFKKKILIYYFLIDILSWLLDYFMFARVVSKNDPNYYFLFFLFFYFLFFLVLTFLSIFNVFAAVRGVYTLIIIPLFASWLNLTILFKFIFYNNQTFRFYISFSNAFTNNIDFSISLYLNLISFSFIYLTSSISICALMYAVTYFKNEPNTDKLILLLGWFSFSMMLLVISDNFILLIVGWELIGLTSFFLINFWTNRRATFKAAFKAFSFNKVSDFCLILFLLIVSNIYNSGSVTCIASQTVLYNLNNYKEIVLGTLFLIIASSIKSAQIFFHIWLPDSMEAPVPASALIHSATLVSAGVYLLTTFQNFLIFTKLYYLVVFIGALTAFYGGLVASAQTDCKKLLAYSTISHCGFLFVTIGLNNLSLTILYLYLHGFFKALTFFCVGNLIRVSKGYQDIRRMGGLAIVLPSESVLLAFSSINLGALPITIGFYYKHFFQCVVSNFPILSFFVPLIFLGTLTSLIYTFRLIYYSMFDIVKTKRKAWSSFFIEKFDNNLYSNSTPMALLAIFILLCISIWTYNFYLSQYVDYQAILEVENDLTFTTQAVPLNSNLGIFYFTPNYIAYCYFILFWSFFWVIFYSLIFINCRAEFTSLKKKHFYLSINLILFLSSFFFI